MKHRVGGFTLIELLVVIAIIAILSVVVILTLNPAELLRQSRDSSRVSDLATIKSAISLFESDVSTSTPNQLGTYGDLYTASANASTSLSSYIGASPSWGFAAGSSVGLIQLGVRTVNGGGWMPVNFSLISSGAPIGSEPVDPVNNNTYYYVYAATSTTFKIAARMESAKYGYGGGGNVVSTDGGNSTNTYEQGTNLNL